MVGTELDRPLPLGRARLLEALEGGLCTSRVMVATLIGVEERMVAEGHRGETFIDLTPVRAAGRQLEETLGVSRLDGDHQVMNGVELALVEGRAAIQCIPVVRVAGHIHHLEARVRHGAAHARTPHTQGIQEVLVAAGPRLFPEAEAGPGGALAEMISGTVGLGRRDLLQMIVSCE